ncbi:glycoside hydrolase family 2 TIM barrel-domain containing protein [Changchengzhania lutea]|uniref:glycoside hydrolase family 2 TIM barrel-domain containing protein n=1 Tax=Changchengzhania lutea TaxID=2049305 RepID=UPI00163DE2DB|nr:glycoside hydrolase family 2 TIM barrel-domain containing protein [Changchengzhania lutea]
MDREKITNENKIVYLKKTDSGYQLFRNGSPFHIQGAAGDSHLKDLHDAGGNTIRVYDTINLASTLDEVHKNNLAAIVDIPIPKFRKDHSAYINEDHNQALIKTVEGLVNTYKNHPALLVWNLGNELDYPLVLKKNNFIKVFNNLIELIHKLDPNHPVSTSLIPSRTQTLSLHLHSFKIDMIGFNAFGNLKTIKPLISKISYITPALPYYVSEWGNSGPWEKETTNWRAPIEPTSTKKAEQYLDQYHGFISNNPQSLGNLVFYWGQKQETTHTWFSIFDEIGRKSQIYYDIESIWKFNSNYTFRTPQINYMLVDKKGAQSNLIFKPGVIKKAEILLLEAPNPSYEYKWEIYVEGWNYNQTEKENKPKQVFSSNQNSKDSTITFKVPSIEGPYRIYVYVYDSKGNFSTANTPFYVLNADE